MPRFCSLVGCGYAPSGRGCPESRESRAGANPLAKGFVDVLDIDDTIRAVLSHGLAGQLDYYTEYLDVARFPEPDYQPASVTFPAE